MINERSTTQLDVVGTSAKWPLSGSSRTDLASDSILPKFPHKLKCVTEDWRCNPAEAFNSLSASSLPKTALAANAAIRANGGIVFGFGAGAGVNEGNASVIPRMHSCSCSCARYLPEDHSDANANDAVVASADNTHTHSGSLPEFK